MPDADLADASVLTSSFYNTYIREQVVVTCTSLTRPTGVEGRVIYETDTDGLRVYDGSSWIGLPAVEADSYTPSLSNVTLGTGSPVNSAEYLWIGGTGVGDHGMLMITGQLTLGTGGSFSDTPQFGLPSGFNWADLPSGATGSSFKIGSASFNDSSPATRYFGWTHRPVASVIGVQLMSVSSSNIAAGSLSSTAPWTWTTGDSVQYNACYEGVRV